MASSNRLVCSLLARALTITIFTFPPTQLYYSSSLLRLLVQVLKLAVLKIIFVPLKEVAREETRFRALLHNHHRRRRA